MRTASRLALGTVLGLVCLALLAGGGIGLGSTVFKQNDHRSHVLRGTVSRVVVEGDSGDVALRPGRAGRATVSEERHFWLRKPKLALTLRDGVLTARVDCGDFGPACSDDLELTVPPDVARTSVTADSGDVRVRGAGGAVDLRADSGDVEAEDVSGDVHLRSDSGNVVARGVRARTVDARADSGDIDLALLAVPRSVSASADSGDVDLDVATGRYRVDADADSGDVDVDRVLRDDTAPNRIDAHADSGDVTVRGR
jgi:putative adhesin